MKIDRTKNATRNIGWGIVEKTISILLPFATRTVLIKSLGAQYLGLNSLFTSILQVFSITELGFGSAIVFSMYKPIAEDDKDTICALLSFYRKTYYIVGSIILFAGLAIIPFLPNLVADKNSTEVNIYVLYLIYLFNTVLSYYLYAYKEAIFIAYQRSDLLSKRRLVISFVSSIAQIILLLLFRNYYVYVIVIPCATAATNIVNAVLSKKMFPDLICTGNISPKMKEGIKKRIIGLLSFKLYGVVFSSVDTIVISAFLGLVPLAIYNNYFYVQTSIIGFLSIITASITAGVGNKMITNSVDENYKDFMNFTFLNAWLSSWCAICLLVLYQHFMYTWMGKDLVLPFHTMILMVLYFFLPRVTTMTYTYREAAGLWWEDRIRPLIATVVNLVVNLFLVRIIGMDGVIISTLICTVFINVPWGSIILFKNYFKISPRHYFLRILTYIAITSVVCVVTLGVCSVIPDIGWGYLLLKMPVCVVVPNAILWLFLRLFPEYSYAKGLVTNYAGKLMKRVHG